MPKCSFRACLKDKIRIENLIIAKAIPDYFERIAALLLINYPESLLKIRICSRMVRFYRRSYLLDRKKEGIDAYFEFFPRMQGKEHKASIPKLGL